MTTAVEADSFSTITDIAANPPAWHSHTLQNHHDPLTLYITRVPGSRDVFLTPLKPRDRVVSAQDVQSSLYYVHFNSADDVELLHSPPGSSNEGPDELRTVQESLLRSDTKPQLPTRPSEQAPALPARPQAPPALPARPKAIARKPVTTNIPIQTPVTLPVLPPRPLPPIPGENVPPATTLMASVRDHQHAFEASQYPLTPLETSMHEELQGTLTLVRREPSTSDQWNVATIQDVPQQTSSRTNSGFAKARVRKSGAPLYIDITNPAYLSFQAKAPSRESTSTNGSDDLHPAIGTFRRRLHLPGSVDLTKNQHRRSMDRSSFDRSSIDMRKTGYTFKSPWEGDCQFTTSTSGRALLCKHRLPGEQWSDEVSELRFNLPVNAKEASPTHERRRSYFTDGRRQSRLDLVRGLANMKNSRNGDDDEDDSVDGPDFTLGQEMAGGGFGGRQPKLGKLIINPPGMAMLDLLVAANVGLWWRAWEKVG
ncbi:hypothetical protein AMS68_005157 [Peltaster fructicola]|uniref:Oxidoreductase-like protein n=1 Tax=Peltaster fructicola TaxID=286661 RepID=A0A6H0XYZ5_9PEZI|nr:hypothetical protein AMS68_005157 [Peltaster fructicola]